MRLPLFVQYVRLTCVNRIPIHVNIRIEMINLMESVFFLRKRKQIAENNDKIVQITIWNQELAPFPFNASSNIITIANRVIVMYA